MQFEVDLDEVNSDLQSCGGSESSDEVPDVQPSGMKDLVDLMLEIDDDGSNSSSQSSTLDNTSPSTSVGDYPPNQHKIVFAN